MTKLTFISSILFIFLLNSCGKGPVFPVEPEIEFLSIQPTVVQQFADSMVVRLRFTDGDGDLGDNGSGDSRNNLIVKDNRTTFPDSLTTIAFTLPNLTPDTKNPSIQGIVEITIPPTALTPGENEEELSFTIYVTDRAGNKSNEVITDLVTLTQ